MARQQRAASGTPASTVGPTGTAAAVAPGADVDDDDVILRLRGVTKSYGAVQVVHGIDLDIRKGEVLTLLGPSGCGKTTTLRMCIGLERASGGTIAHRDRVLDDGAGKVVPIHRRNMGMVFQSYAIWPHMNVAENIAYPLKVRKLKQRVVREAVDRIIDIVGMTGMADRPATQLSGGQQQRVALARALVFEPDLLLLDEPFSNLDARLRDEMRGEVKLMQRRLGITVLFVTHDQDEALSLSDRIAVMSQGRIEQLATPEELYGAPGTRMVRDFLGQSITLDGVVEAVEAGRPTIRLREGAGADGVVVAQPRGGQRLQPGDECEVSIRPEHAQLLLPSEAGLPRNAVEATVEARLFLGERYEIRVSLASGRQLMVFAGEVEAKQLGEGDKVWVDLPEERLLLWADEPGGG